MEWSTSVIYEIIKDFGDIWKCSQAFDEKTQYCINSCIHQSNTYFYGADAIFWQMIGYKV